MAAVRRSAATALHSWRTSRSCGLCPALLSRHTGTAARFPGGADNVQHGMGLAGERKEVRSWSLTAAATPLSRTRQQEFALGVRRWTPRACRICRTIPDTFKKSTTARDLIHRRFPFVVDRRNRAARHTGKRRARHKGRTGAGASPPPAKAITRSAVPAGGRGLGVSPALGPVMKRKPPSLDQARRTPAHRPVETPLRR
jgi:hypothetical protein